MHARQTHNPAMTCHSFQQQLHSSVMQTSWSTHSSRQQKPPIATPYTPPTVSHCSVTLVPHATKLLKQPNNCTTNPSQLQHCCTHTGHNLTLSTHTGHPCTPNFTSTCSKPSTLPTADPPSTHHTWYVLLVHNTPALALTPCTAIPHCPSNTHWVAPAATSSSAHAHAVYTQLQSDTVEARRSVLNPALCSKPCRQNCRPTTTATPWVKAQAHKTTRNTQQPSAKHTRTHAHDEHTHTHTDPLS
jgi:hypothetical protein